MKRDKAKAKTHLRMHPCLDPFWRRPSKDASKQSIFSGNGLQEGPLLTFPACYILKDAYRSQLSDWQGIKNNSKAAARA